MSGLFFCRTYLQTSCRCWVKTVRGLQFSHVSPCAYNKLYPKNVDVLPFKICTVFHSSESRNVMNESKRRTYERPLHQRVIDNLDAEKRVEAMKSSIADQPETDRFGTLSEGNHLDADEVSGTLAREWKRRERQKFLVKKRQNPDSLTEASWSETFGTLSNDVDEFLKMHTNVSGSFADDEGEEDESEKPYVRLSDENRKHKPYYYGRQISKLGKAGKVYEAMEVLEKQMLKDDRVLPNQYVFTVLIGVLGRVGYTKKAFQLFNKMKKFGLDPEDPTYTALFNACSNSPWPADGVQRAVKLRHLMLEKGYSPNMMTYNAMIKAYAKCGDVQKAFAVVDEAIAAGHKPRAPCFCFILMACIADKERGMKLAIEVWRLMRRHRVRPSIHHFNLLLRAVRDCGLGDAEFARELLEPGQLLQSGDGAKEASKVESQADDTSSGVTTKTADETREPNVGSTDLLSATNGEEVVGSVTLSNGNRIPSVARGCSIFDANVPDLLDPRSRPTGVVRLEVPQTAEGRLALLGGLPGVLAQMQRSHAQPNIKTFSLLLELTPSSRVVENDMLSVMTLHGVQPDVDFFAMLIRKRNLRKDYSGAREVLKLMQQSGLEPTIRTFGCMAMGCPTAADARDLLKDIQAVDLIPNVEICEILLFQSHLDFSYKLEILRMMKSYEIRPSEKFLEKLEKSIQFARKKILQKERGEALSEFYASDYFAEGFRRFMVQYRSWLLSMKLEPKVHPWVQFRQPTTSLGKMKAPDDFSSDGDRKVEHIV